MEHRYKSTGTKYSGSSGSIIKGIIHEHLERRKECHGGEEAKDDLLDVLLRIHKHGGVDIVAVEAVIFVSIV